MAKFNSEKFKSLLPFIIAVILMIISGGWSALVTLIIIGIIASSVYKK